MFNFGLFSTHIPYLVFTLVLAAYYGMCALNRYGATDPSDHSRTEESFVSVSAGMKSDRCVDYPDDSDKQFTDGKNPGESLISLLPYLPFIRGKPRMEAVSQSFVISFLSRPPPPVLL